MHCPLINRNRKSIGKCFKLTEFLFLQCSTHFTFRDFGEATTNGQMDKVCIGKAKTTELKCLGASRVQTEQQQARTTVHFSIAVSPEKRNRMAIKIERSRLEAIFNLDTERRENWCGPGQSLIKVLIPHCDNFTFSSLWYTVNYRASVRHFIHKVNVMLH